MSRERLRLLPLRVRLFLCVLLVALLLPGFAAIYGALHDADARGVLAWSSHHLPLVWAGAVALVTVVLLVFERPLHPSARAYAAQLRHRFRAIHAEHERAVAIREREMEELPPPGTDAPDAPARLDGLEAVDHTRR